MVSISDLTITAVSARTGVSVPALRAWEQRYGFPRPDRGEGGHRRYSDTDVERISAVVAERAAGRSLEAAIEWVVGADTGEGTIFAALRRRRPDLPVQVVSRSAMLAISRAIEDESAATADRPVFHVAFQHADVYRRARARRWADFARRAESTTVFADFTRSRAAAHGVVEVAIPRGAPQEREWAVVCEGAATCAVLAGWERPDRRFEAVWSVEPAVVRAGGDAARALALRVAPRLASPAPPIGSVGGADALRQGMAIAARAVAYLDR